MAKFTVKTVRGLEDGKYPALLARPGKTQTPYTDEDCTGLRLVIRGDSRSYQMRYTFGGKSKDGQIKTVEKISLKDARKLVEANWAMVHKGVDPYGEAPKAKGKITFRQDAEIFHSKKKDEWVTAYARNWWNDLENHILSKKIGKTALGDMETAKLTAQDLVPIFQATWIDRPKATHKLLLAVQGVIDYALDRDDDNRFTAPNPARKVLSRLTGGEGLNKAQVPHPSICWKAAPALFASLAARSELAAKGTLLVVLTGARAAEINGLHWSEVTLPSDLVDGSETGPQIHIPGERMKARKAKKAESARDIPLSGAALKVLESIDTPRDGFVFPGRKGKTVKGEFHAFSGKMHKDAMNILLRDMNAGTDVHGLRSTFRTWVQDNTRLITDYDAAELCLAHAVHGVVTRSYARSDMMTVRRELLERWAVFLGA